MAKRYVKQGQVQTTLTTTTLVEKSYASAVLCRSATRRIAVTYNDSTEQKWRALTQTAGSSNSSGAANDA